MHDQQSPGPLTPSEQVVLRVFDRFDTGHSVADLVEPGYRSVEGPWPVAETEGGTFEKPTDPRALGFRLTPRVVSERAGGRVFVETLWTHERGGDPHGRRSAGLMWSVVHVVQGRIRETRYFATRAEAEQHAAAADDQAGPDAVG